MYNICSAFCFVFMLKSDCPHFKKGHTLTAFEDRVQREIREIRREDVTEDSSKIPNQDRHDLYYLTNILREKELMKIEWISHVTRLG